MFRVTKRHLQAAIAALLTIGICAATRAQDAASTPFRSTPPPAETLESPPPEEPPTATPTARPATVRKAEENPSAEIAVPTATAASHPLMAPVRALPARSSAAKPAEKPATRRVEKPAAKSVEKAAPKPAEKPERVAEEKPPVRESRPDLSADTGSVPDTIKRLEREWEAAIEKHDPSAISAIVADDFVGVSSTGRVGDKITLLYEAKRDKNSYKAASARQMTVHTYGSKVAVVLGMTKESGTTANGRPFEHTYRFTDTWMERDGKWQCIAAHAAVAGKR